MAGSPPPKCGIWGVWGVRLARKTEIQCPLASSASHTSPDSTNKQIAQRARKSYGGAIQIDRWQRARARVGCLSPEYILFGNPPHRTMVASVCPCTVSHLLAPVLSRAYVKRAVHAFHNDATFSPRVPGRCPTYRPFPVTYSHRGGCGETAL
eukprot:5167826-Prymnesium_polylepis.1